MKNAIKKCLSLLGLWRMSVWVFDFFAYQKSQFSFLLGLRKMEEFEFGFFFNSYATGGAEKVQLEIVRSVSDKKTAVFFTNLCINEHYKSDFEACSIVHTIYLAIRKRDFYYSFILKNLAKRMNAMKHPKIVGCDCQFFYDLLPYLEPHVTVIDLFHTLVHSFEKGPEHWSLNRVERIQKRIVISYKLRKDFEMFYLKNGVKLSLLDRISTIHNFVDLPLSLAPIQNFSNKPIALFICRNHFVKRIHLAGKIAHRLREYLQFVFIGENLEREVEPEYRSDILFLGNISNAAELAKWYQQADFLMMTSSREGLPMVLLEGMSYGTIPLTTDVGAISEIIPTSELGVLISNSADENEIIENFVGSFKNLLEQPEKISDMKQNVNKFVIQNFSKESFIQAYRKALIQA